MYILYTIYLPVHGLGGIVFEPKYKIDIIVWILREDVTGHLGPTSEDSLHIADRNWKVKVSLFSEIFHKFRKTVFQTRELFSFLARSTEPRTKT